MKSVLMIIKLSISLIKIMAIYQSPNYYVLCHLVNEGVYLWRFLIIKNQMKRRKSILNVNAKGAIVHFHQLSLAVTVISLKSL